MITSDMPVSVSLISSHLTLYHSNGLTDLAPALPKPADIQPPPPWLFVSSGAFPPPLAPDQR